MHRCVKISSQPTHYLYFKFCQHDGQICILHLTVITDIIFKTHLFNIYSITPNCLQYKLSHLNILVRAINFNDYT